jgi:hypothetical protein
MGGLRSLKIPYLVMAMQLERLYQKEFHENDLKAIEEHCNYIAEFIEACGWTIDDYLARFIKDEGN